jgi:type IV pilus assembly protein PilV
MRPLSSGGMSLVECLVALVVLSVGLMGMARLMIQGLRSGHQALVRTQAVNLVSDMSERIRANPGAEGAYECARYAGAPSERNCASTGASSGSDCTPEELAEDDLARWQDSARTVLPLDGALCAANVAYTASTQTAEPSRYRVSVSWNEPGEIAPVVYESDLLLVPLR